MKLNDKNFGRVHIASGAGGFKCDGSEYWPDRKKGLHADTSGITPTVKTVTLMKRDSSSGANMDLYPSDLSPKERLPRSIYANPLPFICCMVNAVGFANFGIYDHWQRNAWQKFTRPWFLSMAAVKKTFAERLDEYEQMDKITDMFEPECKAPFAVKKNVSCPNTGHDVSSLIDPKEVALILEQGATHGRPQIIKLGLTQVTPDIALEIAEHKDCAGLVLANTIPWYDLPLWLRLIVSFGTPFSPLRWRGIKEPGGYSGPYSRKRINMLIRQLRDQGCTKPLIAGGGITLPHHVNEAAEAGADAIAIATLLRLRWWRLPKIVKRANEIEWREQ